MKLKKDILSTIETCSYLLPRVSDTNSDNGSHPMHDIVPTFPTTLLLVALSLKINPLNKSKNNFNKLNLELYVELNTLGYIQRRF